MALFIYFDKDFNFVMSEKKNNVSDIRPGYHCVVHTRNENGDYIWFDFTHRVSYVKIAEIHLAWALVVRGKTNFPEKIQAYLLLLGA